MQIISTDFVMFQNFKHQISSFTECIKTLTNRAGDVPIYLKFALKVSDPPPQKTPILTDFA